MSGRPGFAVIVVSLILLIYAVLINVNSPTAIVYFIFMLSPFLLAWMVYSVIRFGVYKGKELEKGEEWGYQDKSKDELWVL